MSTGLLGWLFHQDKITVTVPVSDTLSGADYISYVLTNNGTAADAVTVNITNGTASFDVSKTFKGSIAITGYDKAGNASAVSTVEKVSVEDTKPTLTVSASSGTQATFGTDWYATAQIIYITAQDSGSGLKSISCAVDGDTAQNLFAAAGTDNGLTAEKSLTIPVNEGNHTYVIATTDNALNTADTVTVTIKQDTVAPSQPTLTASAITDTTVILTASDSVDATSGIKEYTLTEANGKVAAQTNTTGTFSLTGLSANAAYRFAVTATDTVGNQSEASEASEFTTLKTSLAKAVVTLGESSYTYNGTSQIPTVTVTLGGTTLQPSEYTVSCSNTNTCGTDRESINAGTVTVTVTAAAGNYSGTAISRPTYAIGRATLTPDITGTTTKTYDGSTAGASDLAITLTDRADKDTVTANATYTYNNKNVAKAKTITANGITLVNDNGNYKLESTTANIAGTITAKPVDATISGNAAVAYGTSYTHTASYTPVGNDTVNATVHYDGSATKPTNVKLSGDSASAYDLTAVINDSNYTLGNTTGTTAFTITQAAVPGATSPGKSLRYSKTTQQTVTASDFGISLIGSFAANGTVTEAGDVLSRTPTYGTAIQYQLKSNLPASSVTNTVTIPVTFTPTNTNYAPVALTLTVTLTEKDAVTLDLSASKTTGVVYGDSITYTAALNKDHAILDVLQSLAGTVQFYMGDPANGGVLLDTKDVTSSAKTASITLDNTKLTKGDHTVYAIYSGNTDFAGVTASITTNVAPRTLSWNTSGLWAAKRADGNATATLNGQLLVNGALPHEDTGFTYTGLTGAYDSAEAGSRTVTVTVTGAILSDDNYTLPAGSPTFTGKINTVESLPTPPDVPNDGKDYMMEKENGISIVPDSLKGNDNLNTPEKIETQMKLSVEKAMNGAGAANIDVYEVELLFSIDGGITWTKATDDNFPSSGITVVLPYPGNTSRSGYDFVVTHMFISGEKAGTTETITPTKTANGLQFKVYSLSPIAVGYKAVSSGGNSGSSGETAYYTITTSAGIGGSFSTGEKVQVAAGDSAGFTIIPNKGYVIANVLVDGKSVGTVSSYTFTNVRADHTITATFKASGHVNPQTGVKIDFADVPEND